MIARVFCGRRSLVAIACTLGLVVCFATSLSAQRSEYRGFWVDTFNTTLNNHTDVVTVVNRAKAANANAIFAQVRRRGDAWYITPFEPRHSALALGFDPLADLIATAHMEGIEVHAFVIMGAVHTSNATPPNLSTPGSGLHVFNRHGGYHAPSRTIIPGPNNWLTRTLLPDGPNTSFQGHRFGTDFWVDFGHPDAAAYTLNVVMHLVNNYNLDGLHLDRIRYPDFAAAGQTPANGANVGYNPVSVERFNTRYGRTGDPAVSDPLWTQWRRDQVTNIVRRIYLNVIQARPHIKVSGAFIAFGDAPSSDAQWTSAEAYWRVYQDWRAWTEEGIVDLAIPMNYKREHLPAQAAQFQNWNGWMRDHQYDRAGLIGIGNFINPIEGTLRQARSSLLQSSPAGNSAKGVVFFSMATSNAVATNGVTSTAIVNPFALPPSVTPVRQFPEFASALVTGASVNGLTRYEEMAANPTAIFASLAPVPVHPWKVAPTKGHLMGVARRPDNTILDAATVTFTNTSTGTVRTSATDGGGFFGGVDLVPGNYRVKAELGSTTLFACSVTVVAGTVTTVELDSTSGEPPTTTAMVSPAAPDGANGWYVTAPTVTLTGSAGCAALARTEYSLDNGATWAVYSGPLAISQEGETIVLFRSVDSAGTVEPAGSLTFNVDLSNPTLGLNANPSTISPPNGQMINVTIQGTGGDTGSGLGSVSYIVTDEYGMPLSIATRSLFGASSNWTEALSVEARRNGNDRDGRLYTIFATLTDMAGRTTSATTTVVVRHDQRAN